MVFFEQLRLYIKSPNIGTPLLYIAYSYDYGGLLGRQHWTVFIGYGLVHSWVLLCLLRSITQKHGEQLNIGKAGIQTSPKISLKWCADLIFSTLTLSISLTFFTLLTLLNLLTFLILLLLLTLLTKCDFLRRAKSESALLCQERPAGFQLLHLNAGSISMPQTVKHDNIENNNTGTGTPYI